MTEREQNERQAVLLEARQWLNTPYRHMARVKGSGCDCAMFPSAVYEAVGLIPHLTIEGEAENPDIPFYPMDWHLHRSAERYLEVVQRFAREIVGPPRPGDFVLFRFGRAYAHGAIVLEWPGLVHAHLRHGIVYVDAARDPQLMRRSRKYFTLKQWGTE
jgi:cell wall-associated NlpC family hydrolase